MSDWLKLPSGSYIQTTKLTFVRANPVDRASASIWVYNVGEADDPSMGFKGDDAKALLQWLEDHSEHIGQG